ncbi:MBL fold metallo-hydrolase [Pelomonas sp. KK5]|uniref:MBL fold metallo-hydrolase n=1 Tax=Pelomonas sp. KK5 TaxID=1855730 RepID=UPI00097CA30F|nr:MBL fold metallo-hydrolase [Pelomonas sp. KK5]
MDFIEPLGEGLYAIDTGFQRPRFDAAFLLVDSGRAAFIDTGTNHAVPRLLAALEHLGLARDAVDWVIPTHVHLDHAGGAGLLMRELPAARLLVHPRGMRHMVDPSVLWAGATAVYGEEEMQRSYGQLVAVPAERAEASHDGQRLAIGTRTLTLIDTPGHARHHHCIWDERSRGWFTGDTFGLSYREFDTAAQGPWIMPTSTPVQFEPEALRRSIERMMSFEPACMYLTHYARIGEVPRLAALLLDEIDETVAMASALRSAPDRHEALKAGLSAIYLHRVAEHGCDMPPQRVLELLELDIELNAQGLAIWLGRSARKAPAS